MRMLCFSWVVMHGMALAQEPAAKPQEKVVVVEGASPLNPKDVFDTPYSADVVTSGDLSRRQSRTLPEALEEVPGVSVQKTGPGQGSPFIRGFTGFRNVLLIDGIRLNNSTFREGPNQYWGTVDPFLIDRLEVVRGPSSVLYGSDSIGGTVLADTIDPSFEGDPLQIHGRTYGRYSSAEQSYTARQEFSGRADDFGWVVGGTYRDFGDIVGGKHYGTLRGTAYDEYGADAKFVYRLDEHSKLILAAQHFRQSEAPRWHSTTDSRSWHGTTAGTDRERDFNQERNLYYLQYHWAAEGELLDAFRASLSWHRQAEREDRTTGAGNVEVREFEVETPGLWVQAGKQTGIGYLTAGLEVYRDEVTSSGHNRSAAGAVTTFTRGNVADDSTYLLYGIFLQDEFSIGALEVTPGLRFSRAELDADEVDPTIGGSALPDSIDDTYQSVTGSLRLLYPLDDHWNAVAGWGMGFRAPTLDDTTAFNLVLSSALDLPSEGLDPERTHTFDAGLRARHDRWGASAFAFYTILDRFIQRVPAGDFDGNSVTDFTKDNASDGWVYGFEVAAFYKVTDEVTLFGDWGYARGKVEQFTSAGIDAGEQPLSKVGPSMVHLGARYEPAASRVWVEGLVTIADRQSHLSISEGSDGQRIPLKHGTPGYTVYTLRGGYAVTENLQATVAIENITDKDYRVHGSGQNEPGTNAILGVDLRF